MATFGRTTIGSQNGGSSGNLLRGSSFALIEPGIITKLSFYTANQGTTAKMKCAVYDNTGVGGKAGNLKLTSSEVSINSAVNQWWDFPVTNGFLNPGTYWLCFGYDNNSINIFFENNDNEDFQSITYPTFTTPWVVHATTTKDYSIYATYTPAGGAILQYV